MKKSILTTLLICLLATIAVAQAPQSFSYQTIIRSTDWEVIQDQDVSLRLTILEDSPAGDVVYQESHAATTSNIGLVNLAIGEGVILSGDFTAIDWGNHSYFIEVGLDVTGGGAFVPMGTSQLRSVPYALYAETSNNPGPAGADGIDGAEGPQGEPGVNGTNGNDGATGAQGIQGEQGIAGNDGAQGIQGEVGPQGPIGLTGTQGIQGEQGPEGVQGPVGLTGTTGAAGTNGADGQDGAQGEQGPIGLTGATGANGLNGLDGSDGATGAQGPIGLTGATGASGLNGLDGSDGPQGEQGIQGVAGNDGLDGEQGIQGLQGEQGLIGNSIWQQDSVNNISYNAGNVNIGSTTIDSSAVFSVSSQTQGVMLPSMSELERDAINNPTTGLLIFQNDGTAGFYYYNGTEWAMIGGGGSAEFDPTLIYTTDGF